MLEILLSVFAVLLFAAFGFFAFRVSAMLRNASENQMRLTEEKHRAMLSDLHEGLSKQSDRMGAALLESGERLKNQVSLELSQTREAMQSLQVAQNEQLAKNRETLIQQLSEFSSLLQSKLAEQGRLSQEQISNSLRQASEQLVSSIDRMNKTVDERLAEISGKVTERLDEGFKKTNETFTSVIERLATIDEAQKKIDGLTSNVVSLQELLGDKRSRGAFGEVQLESLVRNILPNNPDQPFYAMQHTLGNGARADCVLFLPEPTGKVAVDSKFPLENYHRMLDTALPEAERLAAQKLFKSDVKRHVEDIAKKYIIAGETSDGAVMFVPAEAVFAEIHAYHADLVDYAMQKRVWIVSPTTLMAVLNTARAVLKDVETRKQVHIIKEELAKLGRDFGLFDKRMKNLADHIRLANKDVEEVHVSSRKITQRFAKIEAVELGEMERLAVVPDGGE
jgi:DNA recombination protein RmuC